MNSLLRMEGITKIYPGVVANDGVDFEVVEGEIHALLGENGAGKTTLMNILYGLTKPDAGQILWRGQPVHLHNSKQAMDLGIGMVHQHFMLVPNFTALENIVLGTRTGRGPLLDLKSVTKRVRSLAEQYQLDIDFEAEVEELPLGMRQRIEILKALYRGAHLLILDEPTAVLTPSEVESLFTILNNLANNGHAVILISHKLDEVLAVSHRITALRDGHHIATLETASTSKAHLAQLMVGRPVVLEVERTPGRPSAERLIYLKDLALTRDHGRDQLHGITLEVFGGQVLGIAGIDGNGQRALWEILFGLTRPSAGQVWLMGQEIVDLSPRQVADIQVGRIPEDRSAMGLLPSLSVYENLALAGYFRAPLSRLGVLSSKQMLQFARELVQEYDIRTANVEVMVRNLSGGNQQKVILAREFHQNPKALIVANPTRGLDVGASEYVYDRILALREQGAAILLISSDLEEILCLSDRITVLHNGRIMGELPAEQAERSVLGLMMTGTPLTPP